MVDSAFCEAAYSELKRFAENSTDRFLIEQVREQLPEDFPHPVDGRSWGGVVQRAANDGIIRRAGYAAAKSSNCSPKPLWIKAKSAA